MSGIPFQTGIGQNMAQFPGQVIYSQSPIADPREYPVVTNPYTMGETAYGSAAPLTPSTPPAVSFPQTDTWNRDNPPLDYGSLPTFGVVYTNGPRFYSYGGVTTAGVSNVTFTRIKVFTRTINVDTAGILHSISAETVALDFYAAAETIPP